MTANRNFKRRVRARAAKTGESYTAAMQHLRPEPEATLRLAVGATAYYEDPFDAGALRESGRKLRELMRAAKAAGAQLIHFPEGAICFPHKHALSVNGPERVGPADWERFNWAAYQQEFVAIKQLANELRIWTVIGAVHRLEPPQRPHNSLYVISDRGEIAARYDERLLSQTKASYMYTAGAVPVTFGVNKFKFGCVLGIETHFPELFIEYERLDVDGVLFSSAGPNTGALAAATVGHAVTNSYHVSLALPAKYGPSGVISRVGEWLAQAPEGIAVAELSRDHEDPARRWRRAARAGYRPDAAGKGQVEDREG